MKKYVVLCFLFICLPASLPAQSFWKKLSSKSFWAQRTATQQQRQITRQLRRELDVSYQQASNSYPVPMPQGFFVINRRLSSKQLEMPLDIRHAPVLYPQAEFLTNDAQLSAYFLTQNNQQVLLLEEHNLARYYQIRQQFQRLREEVQPGLPLHEWEDAAWLANLLPEDLSYLVLAQAQSDARLARKTTDILQALHERFAQREIIILTDKLPAQYQYQPKATLPASWAVPAAYEATWKQAALFNMKVYGVELPELTQAPNQIVLEITRNWTDKKDMWQTPEALRIRQTFISQTLAAYRQEHPQALFVLDLPMELGDYASLYSVTKSLAEQEPTVIASLMLASQRFPYKRLGDTPHSFFDNATGAYDFRDRVLHYSPDWRPITGFDIEIQVEKYEE